MTAKLTELISEQQIADGVRQLAREIAAAPLRPDVSVPVLAGAFVFAADLLRALAREGLPLATDFLWLSSYGAAREGSREIAMRAAPTLSLEGRNVLLIDGVLDRGATMAKAIAILKTQGTHSVRTAVAVDKSRPDALLSADHAMFRGVQGFIVGYGMDDGGTGRGLPYIARVD